MSGEGTWAIFGAIGMLLAVALIMLMRRPVAPVGRGADMEWVVGVWENRLAQMPQHSDLSRLYERLSIVEQRTSEIAGSLQGMREMAGRTERYVQTLVQHTIDTDAKKGGHLDAEFSGTAG